MHATITITPARIPDDLDLVRTLFTEYANEQTVELCFQNFTAELAGLPGAYDTPAGRLLLAWGAGGPAGCVALRPRDAGDVEMKRLFVRPAARGRGVGRRLAETILVEARAMNARRVLLDTLPTMTAAIELYRRLGFVEIPPYRPNPLPGALFLARTVA
jgi:ribosomal protein S18 acetylase RimI-like enzyme